MARNSKIWIQCRSSGIEMAQRRKKYFSNAVEACRKTRLQSRRFENIHGMGKAFRLVFSQMLCFQENLGCSKISIPRKSWLLENIDFSKILSVRNHRFSEELIYRNSFSYFRAISRRNRQAWTNRLENSTSMRSEQNAWYSRITRNVKIGYFRPLSCLWTSTTHA